MRTDSLGLPIFDHQDAVDLIYQNRLAVLQDLRFDNHKEIDHFNQSVKLTEQSLRGWCPSDILSERVWGHGGKTIPQQH